MMSQWSRSALGRRVLIGGALAGGALAITPKPAGAFLPLLIRGLLLGGPRAGVAASGRSAVAGTALLRPRSTFRSNTTGQLVRAAFQAGQWYSGSDFSYQSPDHYQWEAQRYPEQFAAVPLQFEVTNRNDRSLMYGPYQSWLSFDQGRVWQAYSLPAFCAPPGTATQQFWLNRIPIGWQYQAIMANRNFSMASNFVG